MFGAAATLFFSGTSPSGLDILSLGAYESNLKSDKVRPASRILFWTLVPVRIFTVIAAGIAVPFTDHRLLEYASDYGVSASPLVISTATHAAAPIVLNSLRICTAVTQLSAGLLAAYGVSRSLFLLARQQQAPFLFSLRDEKGRPFLPLLVTGILALFGYTALSELSEVLLINAVNSGGVPVLFVYLTLFVAHVRFRRGLRKQGRHISGINYGCSTGLLGSYIGIAFSLIVIFSQMWTALSPSGYPQALSVEIIGISFTSYIYMPILLSLYAGYKLYYRTAWRKSTEINYTIL